MISYAAVQGYLAHRRSFDPSTRRRLIYLVNEALAGSSRRVRVALRDRVASAPAEGAERSRVGWPYGRVTPAPSLGDDDLDVAAVTLDAVANATDVVTNLNDLGGGATNYRLATVEDRLAANPGRHDADEIRRGVARAVARDPGGVIRYAVYEIDEDAATDETDFARWYRAEVGEGRAFRGTPNNYDAVLDAGHLVTRYGAEKAAARRRVARDECPGLNARYGVAA